MGQELVEMRSYRDSRGEWWLGMRRFQVHSQRWPAIQPVLGPLEPDGLSFGYLGESGGLVTDHTDVVRIRVRIYVRFADPLGSKATGGVGPEVIEVGLRGAGPK